MPFTAQKVLIDVGDGTLIPVPPATTVPPTPTNAVTGTMPAATMPPPIAGTSPPSPPIPEPGHPLIDVGDGNVIPAPRAIPAPAPVAATPAPPPTLTGTAIPRPGEITIEDPPLSTGVTASTGLTASTVASVNPAAASFTPTTSNDPNNWTFRTKQVYIFQYLQEWANLPPEAAAGVLGNFMWESHLNQDYKHPWGIAQWLGVRIDNLKTFASKHSGDASDFLTQVAFVAYELKNSYAPYLKQLQHTHSADVAAKIIFDHYEVPGDATLGKRQGYARDVMDLYRRGLL